MMKLFINKTGNIINKYIYLFAPILATILFLILAAANNIAPIGKNAVSWCDLNQQGIPLLNQFKDILEGKFSLNGNLSAGGMSYFGVFFFYIASPFSFLVVFVNKADMQAFANVLIMLKIITSSLTVSIYLKWKYPNLNPIIILALSIFYSFSGYVMMYFQTLTWLDMIYLFPLLMLGVDLLIERKKMLPYIIFSTLIVCINYYIGIMAIFYVIFYFSLTVLFRRKEENIKDICFKFLFASFIALLLSMITIIPSLIDYKESSRTISVIESLEQQSFISYYETSVPLVLGVSILIPLSISKKYSKEKIIRLILIILLTIPLFIEPINKMWHYGSYQGFPSRFAFINIFLMLDIVALSFKERDKYVIKENKLEFVLGIIIASLIIFFSFMFLNIYLEENMDIINRYARTLWGDNNSFIALLKYYFIILIFITILSLLREFKVMPKYNIGITLLSFSILEAIFSFRVYMVTPSHTQDTYKDYYSVSNMIDDDSYYNVKSDYKIENVNDIGAMGYNSFGHYTSLTPKGYMDGLKKLGYSSYWMEVGNYGGSLFSDSLLINKYTISKGNIFSSEHYHISENKVYPLGLTTKSNLSKYKNLSGNRVDINNQIYEAMFNDNNLFNTYNYSSLENVIDNTDSNIKFKLENTDNTGIIRYDINITNKTRLYFEAFDKYTNDLSQSINNKITIKVNNRTKRSGYPSKAYNGFVDLGEYENKHLKVDIIINKSINASSFNLFGLDIVKYENTFNDIKSADIKYVNNHFKGSYEAEADEYMFLPIAYSKNIKAKINNKNAEVIRVFDGFSAIKLEKGNNIIDISFEKEGLIPGAFIALIGFGLLISYYVLNDLKKLQIIFDNERIKKISVYVVLIGGLLLAIILYIIPLIINFIGFIA